MSSMNELIEEIKKAKNSWDEIAKQELEEGYSDAMTSIERGEAEGYFSGLLYAYVILNGHYPEGFDNEDND